MTPYSILRNLIQAVEAQDAKLNAELNPQAPSGDDYNTIVELVRDADKAVDNLPSTEPANTAGMTVYLLNARGVNRWSAWVQPGFDDVAKRISDKECAAVAKKLAEGFNLLHLTSAASST